MKSKFAKRMWIIRHLKRAKIPPGKLILIYCSLIRPCFDYASVAYHSMITKGQSDALERMQSIALKTILGWNKSYRVCLEESGLEPLSRRRHKACLRFAEKNADSDRFPEWFPKNPATAYDLRTSERYRIDFARHERLRNAPIYFMRRLLNAQESEPDFNHGDHE